MVRHIVVVPHDQAWKQAFVDEAGRIAQALGNCVVAIHHIGSTAIPGIYAKPIIDFLVEVDHIVNVDARTSALEGLGYVGMGEYGIPGRRYFRKDDRAGIRTHQIHSFAHDSGEVVRHLAFRDYLIAHPERAQRYSELKRRLAAEFPHDIDGYMDGKDPFIKQAESDALEWQAAQLRNRG